MKKFFKKRRAYRQLFLTSQGHLNEAAEEVLDDLRKFCWLGGSLAPEPYALAMAEGRRQVYWRLIRHLEINERVLTRLDEGDS